ncbi:hypothetical protein LEP1GSC123_2475 [Leptospira borgpetersenii str. 200701203]|uniref:Uncharacterized protein n=1 Tax=Leptospira borgpetersenii str. 200701203 TaxID=1193007 RepID=M3GCK4_LEPBO|nr:hypothetical protein LEP1GSC123_2475 [Leptospira borgpetersenii str. 200701203]
MKQFSHPIVMRMKYRFQWNYKKLKQRRGKVVNRRLEMEKQKNVIKEVESYKSVFRFLV